MQTLKISAVVPEGELFNAHKHDFSILLDGEVIAEVTHRSNNSSPFWEHDFKMAETSIFNQWLEGFKIDANTFIAFAEIFIYDKAFTYIGFQNPSPIRKHNQPYQFIDGFPQNILLKKGYYPTPTNQKPWYGCCSCC